MFTLSCRDLGAKDCDFEAEGTSQGEVIGKMMKHVNEDHKDMASKVGREQMMSKIVETSEEDMD